MEYTCHFMKTNISDNIETFTYIFVLIWGVYGILMIKVSAMWKVVVDNFENIGGVKPLFSSKMG